MIVAIYDPLSGVVLRTVTCATMAQGEMQQKEGEAIFFDCPFDVTHIMDGKAVKITPEPTVEELERAITEALEAHYDAVARTRRYDTRFTCALRSGYPGPFQAEGQVFGEWMDRCNAYAYAELDKVLAGQRAMPTPEEAVAELPPMIWPQGGDNGNS